LDATQRPFKVIATAGDPLLGGRDFDKRIIEFYLSEFKAEHDISVAENPKARERVAVACEKANIFLSSKTTTKITIANLYKNISFTVKLLRTKFESLCSDLFDRCLEPVDAVLSATGKVSADVTHVVLTGGSSLIPRVKVLLTQKFGFEPFQNKPRLDVVQGAAVLAAQIKGGDRMDVTDICPLSIGVGIGLNEMEFLIRKYTPIPAKGEIEHFTMLYDQPESQLCIYEGERSVADMNHLIGRVQIPAAPPGEPGHSLFLTLHLDENGILQIEGEIGQHRLRAELLPFQTLEYEMVQMINDGEVFAETDNAIIERDRVKLRMLALCRNIREMINREQSTFPEKFARYVWTNQLTELEGSLATFEDETRQSTAEDVSRLAHQCYDVFRTYLQVAGGDRCPGWLQVELSDDENEHTKWRYEEINRVSGQFSVDNRCIVSAFA
jgi:L1 cell adhesion molecule like protein